MRTVKFRVWLWPRKKYTHASNKVKFKNGHFFCPDAWNKLEQYTSIFDAHGKEIYENDIVRFDQTSTGGFKGIGFIEWCDKTDLCDYYGWYINTPLINYRLQIHGCEIIGNVNQNPELLLKTDESELF